MQGNWERRAELAESRRKSAKEKKIARSNKVTSINSIIVYLQKTMPIDTLLTLWICDDVDKIVCSHYLRLGLCEHRKCKYPHKPFSTILSKMIGITMSDMTHIGKDVSCDEPMSYSLWDITSDMMESIKFISMHNESSQLLPNDSSSTQLIYDHLTPHVWNEFKMKLHSRNSTSIDINSSSHDSRSTTASTSSDTNVNIYQLISSLPRIDEDGNCPDRYAVSDNDSANDESDEDDKEEDDEAISSTVATQLQNIHFIESQSFPSSHTETPITASSSIFVSTFSSCAFLLATFLTDEELVSFFLISK